MKKAEENQKIVRGSKRWLESIVKGRAAVQLSPTALRVARLKAGLTQEDMAARVDLARHSYAQIEAGKNYTSAETAKRIAQIFKASTSRYFKAPSKDSNSFIARTA